MDWSTFSIGNAAGTVKKPGPRFDALLESEATHITIGTITREEIAGNPGRTIYSKGGTSINSVGLKNPGVDYFKSRAKDMALRARDNGKELRWSIAGSNPDEYGEVAALLSPYGTIEADLSCPNVWHGMVQVSMPVEDTDLMRNIMNKVSGNVEERFDLKVPYLYPLMLQTTVTGIRSLKGRTGHIVTCNTLMNGIAYVDRKRVLDSPGGFGGVGGEPLAFLTTGQVAQYQKPLSDSGIKVIAVGAINSGDRAWNVRNEGAVGIQVGTHYLIEGPGIFGRILAEARDTETVSCDNEIRGDDD